MTFDEECTKIGNWIASLVQGDAGLEGQALNPDGYERLKIHARGLIRTKRIVAMQELIDKWLGLSAQMTAAAEQTNQARRERYPQYYSHLSREQRRDWVRLQNEINEFYAKRDIYNQCADDLKRHFSTPNFPLGTEGRTDGDDGQRTPPTEPVSGGVPEEDWSFDSDIG